MKRGGAHRRVALDDQAEATPEADLQWLAIDEALVRLARFDARKARLVELRLFAGLTMEEAAQALGVSEITAKRDWATAKLWILREIDGRSEERQTPVDPERWREIEDVLHAAREREPEQREAWLGDALW